MQFDFLVDAAHVPVAGARRTPGRWPTALERRPSSPDGRSGPMFVRNHDELTLDKLSDAEREEVFAAFGPSEDMQLYGRGLRRRLPTMLDGDERPDPHGLLACCSRCPAPRCSSTARRSAWARTCDIDGRLAVRTPMQWTDGPNGGFSRRPAGAVCRPVTDWRASGPTAVNVADAAPRPGLAAQLVRAPHPPPPGVARDRPRRLRARRGRATRRCSPTAATGRAARSSPSTTWPAAARGSDLRRRADDESRRLMDLFGRRDRGRRAGRSRSTSSPTATAGSRWGGTPERRRTRTTWGRRGHRGGPDARRHQGALYERARKLGVKGRSRMDQGASCGGDRREAIALRAGARPRPRPAPGRGRGRRPSGRSGSVNSSIRAGASSSSARSQAPGRVGHVDRDQQPLVAGLAHPGQHVVAGVEQSLRPLRPSAGESRRRAIRRVRTRRSERGSSRCTATASRSASRTTGSHGVPLVKPAPGPARRGRLPGDGRALGVAAVEVDDGRRRGSPRPGGPSSCPWNMNAQPAQPQQQQRGRPGARRAPPAAP